MALTGSIGVSLQLSQSVTAGLGTAVNSISSSLTTSFADGTATGQVNVLWSSSRSLAATTELLDLNGVLTDAYGASVNLLRVKGIYVANASTVDGENLTIGGAGSNPWSAMFGAGTHKLKVGPSGVFLNVSPLTTGFAVTSGTADQLLVDSGSATITYSIAIIGCTA